MDWPFVRMTTNWANWATEAPKASSPAGETCSECMGKSRPVERGALVLRSFDWISMEVLSADNPKRD